MVTRRSGTIHIRFSESDGRAIAARLRKGYGFFGGCETRACTCHAIDPADRPCAFCETHPIPYTLTERAAGPTTGRCVDCGAILPDNGTICSPCLEARR